MCYDISVLICQYNPDFEKVLLTINSCLLQEKLSIQIVVTDDGSKFNYFNELEEYFRSKNFYDYRLIKSSVNLGTVLNISNGLTVCESEYVKIISPGDFLYNSLSLFEWLQFLKKNNYSMVGSDYVCYNLNEGKFIPVIERAHPQCNHLSGKQMRYNYILNNDIFMGAATISKTDTLKKYLKMIEGKVKFAEDNALRLMQFCGENVGYFNSPTVIYEVGTGISTSNVGIWNERLNADWNATNLIMYKMDIDDKYLSKRFKKLNSITSTIRRRFVWLFSFKSLPLIKLKYKLRPRYTIGELPYEWINSLT